MSSVVDSVVAVRPDWPESAVDSTEVMSGIATSEVPALSVDDEMMTVAGCRVVRGDGA